jgi:O-antigen/teichoic acid export membrane protein
MGKSSVKTIISGSFWGIISKVLDSAAKFVTIPMLVHYYGKGDYGLIALAFSLNAYLRLMDLGMNIGSIRFFSIWITQKEWEKIGNVSRSSIVFYGVIGIVNALIFIYMADHAGSFFNLTPIQLPVFKWMMYVLAASTVLNWASNVITQLLAAHGEMGWVNRTLVVSSLLNFVTAFIAIKLKFSLPVYFFYYTLSTLIVIPLNIYKLNIYNLSRWSLLAPVWNWPAFREILKYSSAIFAMGIFQVTANNLRPLLLGKFASRGVEVLTEYRVIQTITMLVMSFGGVFMDVLLPSASKIYAENDTVKIERMVYEGTKYISIFLSFIVFMLITDSKLILGLYMGSKYELLSPWLIIWLLTVLLAMHNSPVSSLILSTGRTRFLVYSSAVSCFASLPVTIIFAKQLNVGAAVLGYFFYMIMQIGFYYVYYIPKVLKLKSLKLFFGSFFPSFLMGLISAIVTYYTLNLITFNNPYIHVLIQTVLFSLLYSVLILLFGIKKSEYQAVYKKFAR